MRNKKFKIGDLVRWRTKELSLSGKTGIGVIINEQTYKLTSIETKYTNYMVYRNKHNDILAFDSEDITKI